MAVVGVSAAAVSLQRGRKSPLRGRHCAVEEEGTVRLTVSACVRALEITWHPCPSSRLVLISLRLDTGGFFWMEVVET